MSDNIEKIAADTLMEKGVKCPLSSTWWMRMFGKKKLYIIVKQPHLGTLYRISGMYLNMNMDIEKLENISMHDGYQLFNDHAKTICKIIAAVVLRGNCKYRLFGKIVAGYILRHSTPKELCTLLYTIMLFSGIADFCNIIRLTSTMKMTTPRNLSQNEKGS